MNSGRPWPVGAGVDFSAAGDQAADYAAREALRRGLDLRLVHGLVIPIPSITPYPALYDDAAIREQAQKHLDELAETLRTRYPGLVVGTKLAALAGGITLIEESASLSLLVVGSRGQGGFARLLIGSTAGQIATYATCPVIVTKDDAVRSEGPVVAGVDGSEFTTRTLRFGFEEAAARGTGLVAVHVWCLPEYGGLTDGTQWSKDPNRAQEQMQETAERVLAEALAGWEGDYPQVPIERVTRHGDRPAKVLLEVCDQHSAGLLVVGSRGRGGFIGPLLGSVSQSVVAHANIPVAVVHRQPNEPAHTPAGAAAASSS